MERRGLLEYFEALEDPRIERMQAALLGIITIAILTPGFMWRCSAGGSGPFWSYPTGVPRHLRERIFPVGPRAVPGGMEWSQGVAELLPGAVVAVWEDSTAFLRHQSGKGALHLVSAWAAANTLTLGQVSTEEKSNEITPSPGCWNCRAASSPLTPWGARIRRFWTVGPTTCWR